MTHPNYILQELKELNSSLTHPGQPTGFRVPPTYFDGLADEVMSRIRALEGGTPQEELVQLSPLLNGISRKLPYAVPANYFEQLAEMAVFATEQTAGEELESLSPLLSGLKQTPYSVPAGYFDNLETKLEAADQQAPARVISMGRSNWFRYAVAAVVVGFVALGGFFFLNKNQEGTVSLEKQPYAWIETNMKKVSTDEINQFVELVDETKPVMAQLSSSDDIKMLMKNVPDKEIQEFLNDTQTADAASDDEDDDVILN